mmetsp:Transcript_12517/g.22334  ORF Transcript_12517/g.22334 Transcript_12517/m.22334 type:complete len:508 (+) Transcript_12517:211-1734(+)
MGNFASKKGQAQTNNPDIIKPLSPPKMDLDTQNENAPEEHNDRENLLHGDKNPKSMNWLTLVYLSAITSSLTSILLGYDVGVMSGAILYIVDGLSLNTVEEEFVIGSLNLVAAFGGLLAGKLADGLGRKKAIGVSCVIFIVGASIMTTATNFWVLLAGRIVTGVGVGCGFVTSPLYISEITPPDMRGMLVSLTDISINFGIVLGYLSAYAVNAAIAGDWKWRVMLGIGMVPPAVILFLLVLLPESPRWLASQGRSEEARSVLNRVMPDEATANQALVAIESALTGDDKEASWREVYFPEGKVMKRVLWVVLGLGFWQQVSGSESVVYYVPTILEDAGLSSTSQLLLGNMAVGLFKLGGEVVAAVLVERQGRRPLLMASVVLQTVFLFLISAAFCFYDSIALDLVTMCGYMWWFSFGLGPVTWVSASELLPLRVRSKALAGAVFLNRLLSGTISLTFLSLSDALTNAGAFFFYGCISFISIFFYAFFIPETRGKTLEEIQQSLTLGHL